MKTLVVKKPWGQFDQFTSNEKTTVKILRVNKGNSLSLQYHQNRSEFWRVLSGHPLVSVGSEVKRGSPGDEFFIDKSESHRLEALEDDVQILEIAHGDFNENDIIRIEDKYGRV